MQKVENACAKQDAIISHFVANILIDRV